MEETDEQSSICGLSSIWTILPCQVSPFCSSSFILLLVICDRTEDERKSISRHRVWRTDPFLTASRRRVQIEFLGFLVFCADRSKHEFGKRRKRFDGLHVEDVCFWHLYALVFLFFNIPPCLVEDKRRMTEEQGQEEPHSTVS